MGAVRYRALMATVAVLVVAGLWGAACGGDGGTDKVGVTVNSNKDTAERDGALTLREAISLVTGQLTLADLDDGERGQVKGTPGVNSEDIIRFEMPSTDERTIALESPLPPLTSSGDTIDGSVGGDANADRVVIDGVNRSRVCVEINSSANALQGLRFVNCRTAILVREEAVDNHIGSRSALGNVISGNVVGIEMRGHGNFVQGNYIGLDPATNKAQGNEFEGIWVTPIGRENTIGGSQEGEGNVISGNPLFGISIDGSVGNVVQGNLIGLDVSGSQAVGNNYGITVQAGATGNLIGGDGEGERNVISGSNSGLLLRDANTTGNTVRGNYFGTSADGQTEIRNAVDIYQTPEVGENVLEGNRVTSEAP